MGNKMKKFKIRQAGPEEIPLLADIIRKSFYDVAVRFGLTKETAPRHPSNCEPDWIKKDMDRGAIYLLLEEENQTCGCVAYEIIGNDLCYLERLAVLPQKRKQRLGGKLVNHVFNAAKQSGAERVSIGIISEQTELKKWYEKIGFVETHTKKFDHLPFVVSFMSYDLVKNPLIAGSGKEKGL